MSYFADVAALARKDLLLELRAKETLPAMLLFVLSALTIFHFALPRGTGHTAALGLLWIALVFTRAGNHVAVVFTIVAVAGSFLVPYVRAKAEALGLRGDVGLGSRAERVVVITAGLVFAPWGGLQWAIYVLAATSWLTVLQRILHVRKQLIHGGKANVRN